jgi:transposase
MEKRINQRYTPELKAEAIKLVIEQRLSVAEVATRLNMNEGTLAYWIKVARRSIQVGPPKEGMQSLEELAAENRQLRKELAESRMERDILKKATAYFAKESLPSTRS